MLPQSKELGKLAFAFDEGRDLEVDSSPSFYHALGVWAVECS